MTVLIALLLASSAVYTHDFGITEDAKLGPLALADSLDVGNTTSEAGHQYSIDNETWSGLMTMPDEKGGAPSDDGRANRGKEAFTLHAPLGKDLYLYKRLSRGSSGQLVNVTVNGKFIGSWAQTPADKEGVLAFGTAALLIPRELAGTETLRFELGYAGGAPDVNSFMYALYAKDDSIVPLAIKKVVYVLVTTTVLAVILRLAFPVLTAMLARLTSLATKSIPALIRMLRQRKINAALLPLAALSLICLVNFYPYFSNLPYWGNIDWGAHSSYVMAARESILRYSQFPLWDPYYCGGMSLISYPESIFLSPLFIPIIPLGLFGIRITVILATLFGMIGFYRLSRHLDIGSVSSVLPPIIFFLNTQYQNRIQFGGFAAVLPMAFIPWIFLYYLKAIKSTKYLVISSLLLSLDLLSGSPIFPTYFAIFLGVFAVTSTITTRNLKYLTVLLSMLALGLMMASIKLMPAYDFMRVYPRTTENYIEGYSMRMLDFALLHKPELDYLLYYNFPEQMWGWHEYTAYVGLLPILLAILGLFHNSRIKPGIIAATLILLWLALGHMAPYLSLWDNVHTIPPFTSLRVPERFINIFFVGLAILSGFGLSRIEGKHRGLSYVLLSIVVVDLLLASSPLVNISYTAPSTYQLPLVGQREENFFQYGDQIPAISAVLLNVGNANCYGGFPEIMKPALIPRVLNGKLNPQYRGEAYLLESNGTAVITRFSPNTVTVQVNAVENDVLVLNQNYFPGWYTLQTNDATVDSYNGLISTNVTPSDKQITFSFLPLSFIIGALMTFTSISLIFYAYFNAQKLTLLLKRCGILSMAGKLERYASYPFALAKPLYSGLQRYTRSSTLPALTILVLLLYLLSPTMPLYSLSTDPPEKGLIPVGELDVGNNTQEVMYGYEQSQCSNLVNGTFTYPNGVQVADDGRHCLAGGYEILRLPTTPGRDYYLLKRLDFGGHNQGVKLDGWNYSAGKEFLMGYYLFEGNDTSNRWRNVYMRVPKEYVVSNTTILIIRWGSGPSMNSYHYWFYASPGSNTDLKPQAV